QTYPDSACAGRDAERGEEWSRASRKGTCTGGEGIWASSPGVGENSSSPREGCGGESSGGEASGSGREAGSQSICQGCPSAEGSGSNSGSDSSGTSSNCSEGHQ